MTRWLVGNGISAEGIVRKLRHGDELAAEGKSGEEIAAELCVSAATVCNWRGKLRLVVGDSPV
jgi:putative transposase